MIKLYEPNGVILPPDAPEVVSGHVAIRAVLEGILALKGKMENTIVRVIERQDIAILYSRWTVSGTGPDGTPVVLLRIVRLKCRHFGRKVAKSEAGFCQGTLMGCALTGS